jgi:hypothetical protein
MMEWKISDMESYAENFQFGVRGTASFVLSNAASAAPCDRACLLEQAKQFNANMLAHTSAARTRRVPATSRLRMMFRFLNTNLSRQPTMHGFV